MDNNEERKDVLNETPKQEEVTQQTNKKGISKFVAIISAIVVILIVAILGVFLFGGNLFASKGQKFVKLATVDQKFLSVFDTKNKDVQINSELKIDIDGIVKEIGGEPTGLGALKLENKEIIKNEDYTDKLLISLDGMKDAKFELQIAKNKKLVGVHIPEITEKFIAVDLDDVDGLLNNLKKLGINIELENSKEHEFTENDRKELEDLLKKYIGFFADISSDYIDKKDNAKVEANGKSEVATEYKLTLDGESILKLAIELEKEFLKNERDIDKLVELGFIDDKDEFIEGIKNDMENNKSMIEDGSYKDLMGDIEIIIKLYEKNGKNIATVVEVEDVYFGFYMFETSKDDYEAILELREGPQSMRFVLDITTEKNVKNGKLEFVLDTDEEDINVTLFEAKKEELNKIEDEIIKISKDDVLLLNTATEDELEEYVEEATKNAEKFVNDLLGIESGKNNDLFIDEIIDNDYKNYDDKSYDDKNYDKEDEAQKDSTVTKVTNGRLAEAQKLFDKIDLKMTKNELISAAGKPDDEYTPDLSSSTLLSYKDDKGNLIGVIVKNDEVVEVEIRVSTADIVEELNPSISDLSSRVEKVEKGMKLSEVEEILGKKYIQSMKSSTYDQFTWYDSNGKKVSVVIEDGKVTRVTKLL